MGLPSSLYRDIELIRGSTQMRVYRARRRSDDVPVIARVFDAEDPELEARVEHEFAALAALDVPGVTRALECGRVGEKMVLLFEPARGSVLADELGGRSIDAFGSRRPSVADQPILSHQLRPPSRI